RQRTKAAAKVSRVNPDQVLLLRAQKRALQVLHHRLQNLLLLKNPEVQVSLPRAPQPEQKKQLLQKQQLLKQAAQLKQKAQAKLHLLQQKPEQQNFLRLVKALAPEVLSSSRHLLKARCKIIRNGLFYCG